MEIAVRFIQQQLNQYVLPESIRAESLLIHYLINWGILVGGGYVFYLFFSTCSYLYFFRWKRDKYYPVSLEGVDLEEQIKVELGIALRSIPIMGIFMAPFPVAIQLGYSKMYYSVSDYGWGYLLASIPFFLVITDMMIYWIHYALHSNLLYSRIHKPHHTYKFTTPYSSHAFHPLDGWSQGVPYYIFTFFFPFNNWLFIGMFIFVNFWTISIHDQVDFSGAGVLNSTGHHTIHHRDFKYNYGQYFTFWDRLCKTYKPAEQTHSALTGEPLPHHTFDALLAQRKAQAAQKEKEEASSVASTTSSTTQRTRANK